MTFAGIMQHVTLLLSEHLMTRSKICSYQKQHKRKSLNTFKI